MQLRRNHERMHGDRAAVSLMTRTHGPAAQLPPVFGAGHVCICYHITFTDGRDNVGEQDANRTICSTRLNNLCTRKGFNLPVIHLARDDGAKKSSTDLRTHCQAVPELRGESVGCTATSASSQRRDDPRIHQRTFSGVDLSSEFGKAAFSRATHDSTSDSVKGLMFGEKVNGRTCWILGLLSSLAARFFWLIICCKAANSEST